MGGGGHGISQQTERVVAQGYRPDQAHCGTPAQIGEPDATAAKVAKEKDVERSVYVD